MTWAYGDNYSSAILFTGTFSLTYILWNQLSRTRRNGYGNIPPSIGYFPLLGSMPYVPSPQVFHKFFHEKRSELGDVVSFESWHKYVVVLSSDEAIREALLKQSTDSADRPHYYLNEFLNPQRKGIIDHSYNPTFKKFHQLSLSILKEFGFGSGVMESRISVEVEDLISNLRDLQGAPVYPKSLVASSVMSVISSIVLGDRLKDRERKESFVRTVKDIFECFRESIVIDHIHSLRHLPKFKRLVVKVVSAQNESQKLLRERVEEYISGRETKESFISSFISREGEDIDVEQLTYTLRDFMLAGFETSSTTLLWILLTLANHQEVQKRLQKELDSVVPRDRLPSLDDKSQLPYLEAVVLEVMRRHTLAPTGLSHAAAADIIVNGFVIPKGSQLITNIYAAHMDKRSWEEPEVFRPERFLDSTGTNVINKEKVISFSLGKRSCLGELLARQEIYLFITGLLQQFHICPPEGVDHIDVENTVTVTLQPTPFHIRFLSRD